MRFLVDHCAGRRVADWLKEQGHDVLDVRELGPDPGDRALLAKASAEDRILVTLDKHFGRFVFLERSEHAGLIRLPDLPAAERIRRRALRREDRRDRSRRGRHQGAEKGDEKGRESYCLIEVSVCALWPAADLPPRAISLPVPLTSNIKIGGFK